MSALLKIHHVKVVLIIFCLFLFSIYIFVMQNYLFCAHCELKNYESKKNTNYHQSKITNFPFKRVTKSLSDMKKLMTLNQHVLMFNYGPKRGSEMFLLILKWLQGSNNFKHFHLRKGQTGRLSSESRKSMADFVSNVIRDLATPVSFDSSSYFTNISMYGWDAPTYFGIIRDPGELFKINFAKSSNENIIPNSTVKPFHVNTTHSNLNIPYFCGHHLNCIEPNSEWALFQAKENVMKFYPVVGVIEYLDETLYVLEKKLKYFFRGSTAIYQGKFQEKHTKWKQNLGKREGNSKEIKNLLYLEYDFYHWIKSRLFDQVKFHQRQGIEKSLTKKIPNLNFQIEEP